MRWPRILVCELHAPQLEVVVEVEVEVEVRPLWPEAGAVCMCIDWDTLHENPKALLNNLLHQNGRETLRYDSF